MGSDSDLPVMKAACEMLEKFKIEYECTIVSAHRTPDRLVEYARSARRRGPGGGLTGRVPRRVTARSRAWSRQCFLFLFEMVGQSGGPGRKWGGPLRGPELVGLITLGCALCSREPQHGCNSPPDG